MSYGLFQSTAPTDEPISLDDVKLRIGVPVASDIANETMQGQLNAAVKWVENRTNRQLCTASWTMTLDCWPACGKIYTPKAPLRSITTIHYLESTAGASTLWASSNYRVITSTEPGEVTLAYGASWPALYPVNKPITIVFSAGYGAKISVPQDFIQAITLKCAEWWATNPADAQHCARSCEAMIPALSYGDDFVRYGEEVYA